MDILSGKSISPGFADGYAVILTDPKSSEAVPVTDVDTEIIRFQRAVQQAKEDIKSIRHRVHREFGAGEAEIFAAYGQILEDPVFIDDIVRRIQQGKVNAEKAIIQSTGDFAMRLKEAGDPYLREREQDIRDIGRRLVRHIRGHTAARLERLEDNAIIVAAELMPSDLMEVDYGHLKGVVTERSGETSHVAILARALGIPAITGIVNVTGLVEDGQQLLVNGDSGELIVQPSLAQQHYFQQLQVRADEVSREAQARAHLPCCMADGTEITLLANLGRPTEEDYIATANLSGVGLLRTEFLFLDKEEPPSVREQISLYRQVAERTKGELVIRTLDLGGDKFPLFLERQLEGNPNMGSRGLRFSLSAGEELFRSQVEALLHIAVKHPISIMFPMVVGIEDLAAAKAIVSETADAMEVEGLPPMGVLIETPSAVLMIDELLDQVDFVSIGTNDLTQFILAADRNSLATMDDYSVLHPSVLRAISRIVEAANAKGKTVTVCGEAAGIPEVACLFIGMGVRRLSMSPRISPKVKYVIGEMTLDRLQAVAAEVLASPLRAQVAEKISTWFEEKALSA